MLLGNVGKCWEMSDSNCLSTVAKIISNSVCQWKRETCFVLLGSHFAVQGSVSTTHVQAMSLLVTQNPYVPNK
jgi:hypothetical protein